MSLMMWVSFGSGAAAMAYAIWVVHDVRNWRRGEW